MDPRLARRRCDAARPLADEGPSAGGHPEPGAGLVGDGEREVVPDKVVRRVADEDAGEHPAPLLPVDAVNLASGDSRDRRRRDLIHAAIVAGICRGELL